MRLRTANTWRKNRLRFLESNNENWLIYISARYRKDVLSSAVFEQINQLMNEVYYTDEFRTQIAAAVGIPKRLLKFEA